MVLQHLPEFREYYLEQQTDRIVVEEPLRLLINNDISIVLMRTPGYEQELATGFCLTEGMIESISDIEILRYCKDDVEESYNTVEIRITGKKVAGLTGGRRLMDLRTSCGICGKDIVGDIVKNQMPVESNLKVSRTTLLHLVGIMENSQKLFALTGGTHAAGIFDNGRNLIVCREDIGRHNALDKAVGYCLFGRLDMTDKILLLSGRASYEMVVKTVRAGIPVVASISAPTSLAIDVADALGCTLVGFLRSDGMNVYTHKERIV
jgi:FdhD protein